MWVPEPPSLAACKTFVDVIRLRARMQPDREALTFLDRGETISARLASGELDQLSRRVGGYLQTHIEPGDRVLLMFPQCLEFVVAFTGCLYGGMTAVPANPPQGDRFRPRMETLMRDTAPALVLTCRAMAARLPPESGMAGGPSWVCVEDIGPEWAEAWTPPGGESDTVAFLQFTSGSTGDTKGVMVTHGNILHNLALMQEAFAHRPDSSIVSWLPFFHDWGLIGGLLQPLYAGIRGIVFDPAAFLQRPIRWLRAISTFRATVSGAPNFAYDHCLRAIPAGQRADLDLSSWEVAILGAEPIRPDTVDAFCEAFSPQGFRPGAIYPSYGLAESTLAISGGPRDRGLRSITIDGARLEQGRVAMADAGGSDTSRRLASCGPILGDLEVLLVDPASGLRCGNDEVGEIWVRGGSVAAGYWAQAEATRETFAAETAAPTAGPFLRTGDLGLFSGGELFVTGRIKDLIILAGRNHYPQDIELCVEACHPALRPSGAAAFAIDAHGAERLIVVCEIQYGHQDEAPLVIGSVQKAVAVQYRIFTDAIVLVKPGTMTKTSSGKVQRRECRQRFLEGSLAPLAAWQNW